MGNSWVVLQFCVASTRILWMDLAHAWARLKGLCPHVGALVSRMGFAGMVHRSDSMRHLLWFLM